jgi:ribosome-binding factor A
MSKSKSLFSDVKNLKELHTLVGELRPGDGVDPRLEARCRKRDEDDARLGQAHGEHRQEQFLAQIQAVVDSALLAAVNPVLNTLAVRDVAHDGGSFVVVLEPRDAAVPIEVKAATEALEKATSMLTREVAAAITRKEVPHLKFLVLPAGAVKVDE